MSDERCDNCRFYEEHGETGDGVCRRFPPVLVHPEPKAEDTGPSVSDYDWPMVNGWQWCGEFDPDIPENLRPAG